MLKNLLNNPHVSKVICTDEEKLGAGKGFLVWLEANQGCNLGSYDDEDYIPRYSVMFKGKTINEALGKAVIYLDELA